MEPKKKYKKEQKFLDLIDYAEWDSPHSNADFIAFSPDGKFIAIAYNWYAKIVNLETRESKTIEGADSIGHLAFSNCGTILASSTISGYETVIWDVKTGKVISSFHSENDDRSCDHFLFSKSENTLMAGVGDDLIRIIDLKTFKVKETIATFKSQAISLMAFHPNENTAAFAFNEGIVKLYNFKTMELLKEFKELEDKGNWIATKISPDGKLIASAVDEKECVILWEIESGNCLEVGKGFGKIVRICFHPTSKLLATSHQESAKIRIWCTKTGNLAKEIFTGCEKYTSEIEFHPRGHCIAFDVYPNRVALSELYSLEALETLLLNYRFRETILNLMPPEIFRAVCMLSYPLFFICYPNAM